MRNPRIFLLLLSISVSGAFLAGCTKRPVNEIADARAAMKAAQDNCVEYYLPKDYEEIGNLLEEARKRDEDAFNSMFGSYKNARIAAVKTKEKAGTSMTRAADLLRRAKNDAERTIREAMYAIESADKAEAKQYAQAKFESAQALLVEAKNIFFVSTCGYSAAIEKAKLAQITADEAVKQAREEKEKLVKLEAERLAREDIERLASERAALETKTKTESQPSTTVKPGEKKEPEPTGSKGGIPQSLTEYVVGKGEMLWQIAGKRDIYGDPYLWPILYKANRSQIKDPTQISEGQKLTVPRNMSSKEIEEATAEAKEKGLWSENGEDREKGPREQKPAPKE